MALWKRGNRYWTLFRIDGVLYRKPLCPPGETVGTTDRRLAFTLEKDVIREALAGNLKAKDPVVTLAAACDDFVTAKRAVANRARTADFTEERLKHVRRLIGESTPIRKLTRETIEKFQASRRAEGAGNRTINMDVGALRQVLKRQGVWKRLEEHVVMLSETGGEPVGRVLSADERVRLFETAQSHPEWEHVYAAAMLAANTSMRSVEIRHLRRRDIDTEKSEIRIRHSKNEGSRRVIPLNAPALEAVMRMLLKADSLGHTDPEHYLWFATPYAHAVPNKIDRLGKPRRVCDPTTPADTWDKSWRSLRKAAGLPWLRFHDLRHTVVTELLEAGVPDHVVQSITGHLSKRMLEHYSHTRIAAKREALDQLDESRKAVTTK